MLMKPKSGKQSQEHDNQVVIQSFIFNIHHSRALHTGVHKIAVWYGIAAPPKK
jgi:hypothetical protein